MIRRPPRSTLSSSSAASDVYKRQASASATQVSAVAWPDRCIRAMWVLGRSRVPASGRPRAGASAPAGSGGRRRGAPAATAETWVADADADPVLVVTAPPAASLASELVRLLPELRALLGPDRRATVVFDRGGLSLIHISEPTRLLSISYAVFCLKKKKK